MKNQGFYEYVMTEVFSEDMGIIGRRMFGGYGIYKDGVCFGLIDFGKLYFKVDETNKADYEQHNSAPFQFPMKNGKMTTLSYWEVPVDILEDRSSMPEWIKKAVAVAKATKKK